MKTEDKELFKETFRQSRFGFLLFFCFWLAGWLGVPVFLLYCGASALIVFGNIKNKNTPQNMLIDFAWLTGIITFALWLGALLGGKGLLGILIIVIILSMIILWRKRKLYMEWIYHIEERFLYGERLRRKK